MTKSSDIERWKNTGLPQTSSQQFWVPEDTESSEMNKVTPMKTYPGQLQWELQLYKIHDFLKKLLKCELHETKNESNKETQEWEYVIKFL